MAEKDAQLEFKKRARRRLVGAVALALLAAVVLPIVMDQEPKPINQDIQIRIPSRDSPFDGRVAAPPVPGGGETAKPTPAVPVQSGGSSAPTAEPSPAAQSAALPPAKAQDKSAEKPAEKVAEKPAAKSPDKVAAVAPKAAGEEARARAILDAKDEYVVQLGVFTDPENVRKVQARVKAEGYNSFTEQLRTSTGVKTRVRAGPFAGREVAEQARDKLKRGGLDGMVAPKS